VGGLLIGFGMVLASCFPQRSLVKAGAGSLKAVITLLVVVIRTAASGNSLRSAAHPLAKGVQLCGEPPPPN
jgi:uncharacterized membrane protein YedE/YeeE